MRDKRRRGPGSQGPSIPGSNHDGLDDGLHAWAEGAANDNDDVSDVQSRKPSDLAHDFGDEATTLYQRDLRPQINARTSTPKPARRPSARYRPEQHKSPGARGSLPPSARGEPRFGVEGSLPRSLRPGQAPRSRYGIFVGALLVVGVAALWTLRDPGWSRAIFSVSPHHSSGTSSRSSLGQGHVVETETAAPAPLEPAPSAPTADSQASTADDGDADGDAPEIMEFKLADVPDEAEDRRAKRRARRAWLRAHGAHQSRDSQATLGQPIQPLVEDEADYHEPVYYRAAVNEGTLQVNSRPWARVLVDGRFVGHTPQRALRLPAGRHHVQLVNEQLDMSKLFDVVITPGDVVTRVEFLDENAHTSR